MKGTEFKRILVANRAEIASRIIRAIHQMDKEALVIYAKHDKDLPFVAEADEAWPLGSGDLSLTYLNMELILNIAREANVDAIHPGYGFLAENAAFARACEESGIHFIGPTAEVIELMGHKSKARDMVSKLGLPVPEGVTGDLDTLLNMRFQLPYPLLIKPAAGGGGKGMRIVQSAETFEQEALEASREALNYFGSGELYVEKFLEVSRHIEVQVIADHYGNRAHLFERECSLQRRYQKIIEEAPSEFISDATRGAICSAALELIKEIGYTSVGTVEFLLDQNQDFYFMEMNTRIQVEHPVSELLTGIDLLREQIAIAQGQALSFSQSHLSMEGHVMEARLYAEEPAKNFLPSSGKLAAFELPADKEIRIDSGYRAGNLVEPWYDPMLAKLIVKGKNRMDARRKMIEALEKTHISGLSTNRDFLIGILHSDHFKENMIHTRLIDMEIPSLLSSIAQESRRYSPETLLAAACFIALDNFNTGSKIDRSPWQELGHWRIVPEIRIMSDRDTHLLRYRRLEGNEQMCIQVKEQESIVTLEHRSGHHYRLRINEKPVNLWAVCDRSEILLDVDGQNFEFRRLDVPDRRYIPRDVKQNGHTKGEIAAPLNGRVVEIYVHEGDRVTEGVPLVVIESMKMENKLLSDQEAIVKQIEVRVGQQVQTNQILLSLASI